MVQGMCRVGSGSLLCSVQYTIAEHGGGSRDGVEHRGHAGVRRSGELPDGSDDGGPVRRRGCSGVGVAG